MMKMLMHDMGRHGWNINWVWMLGIIILLLIIWLALRMQNPRRRKRRFTEKSALDILEERYARGEIDEVEFDEKKRRLR